jgi:GAF domain-containing protein
MKTSWTAYSVDTRTPSIATLPNDSTRGAQLDSDIALVYRLASRISSAAPLDEVLSEVAGLVADAVNCDSCTVYVAEGEDLVLRAWSNPSPETANLVKVKSVLGATGWGAGDPELVSVLRGASADPRVRVFFSESVGSRLEGFLSIPMLSGGRLAGVINVQNRTEHAHDSREISLVATLGLLTGAEIERARLRSENAQLVERLESRKIVERAKGILQRDLQLSEEDAYLTLQRESRQRRKSMKEVAEAIILSEDLKKKK